MPKTRLGKGMFLNASVDDKSSEKLGSDELIGEEADVLIELAPTGRVSVGGKQYEAFSKDGLIKEGERVTVVGRDNFRIIVKKANP